MTYAEKIINICNNLTEYEQKEICDFAEYLSIKRKRNLEEIMDKSITQNIEALKELAK